MVHFYSQSCRKYKFASRCWKQQPEQITYVYPNANGFCFGLCPDGALLQAARLWQDYPTFLGKFQGVFVTELPRSQGASVRSIVRSFHQSFIHFLIDPGMLIAHWFPLSAIWITRPDSLRVQAAPFCPQCWPRPTWTFVGLCLSQLDGCRALVVIVEYIHRLSFVSQATCELECYLHVLLSCFIS